jgi:hypothetical protein
VIKRRGVGQETCIYATKKATKRKHYETEQRAETEGVVSIAMGRTFDMTRLAYILQLYKVYGGWNMSRIWRNKIVFHFYLAFDCLLPSPQQQQNIWQMLEAKRESDRSKFIDRL